MNRCPSQLELYAFCRGDMPSAVVETLAAHISGCARCATLVAQAPDALDPLLTRLRFISTHTALPGGPSPREAPLALAAANADRPGANSTCYRPIPTQLREYQLLDKLGEGGMGAVYRAVHTQLDKVVALKVLAARLTEDGEAVARFHREMKAVGKLTHANIIQATDAGIADGTHFLVMEYVEGLDLASLVRQRGPLPVADACEVARQAALGLHHAHELRLVHRDVKPSNLMLSFSGVVKVLDLGLARLQGELGQGSGDTTSSGQLMGSYDFMAPEQAEDPRKIDARADLYGLGCTLFHLLTGRPPFADLGLRTAVQKINAHARDPVPSVRALRPEISEKLNRVVATLLAKRPESRFASAAKVARVLTPLAAGADLKELLRSLPAAPTEAAPGTPVLADGNATTGTATSQATALRRPKRAARKLAIGLGVLVALMLGLVIYVKTNTSALNSGDKETLLAGSGTKGTAASKGGLTPVATAAAVPGAPVELKPKAVLEGHTDWVAALALSPDGKWLASAGWDQSLRVWAAKRLQLHRRMTVADQRVSCLAFSGDGKTIAGACSLKNDGDIHLWDADTGAELDVFRGNRDGVLDLAFSPDGKWLAAGGGDRKVSLWDVKQKRVIMQTPATPGLYVRRLAFAPDSQTLVFCNSDVYIWNIPKNMITSHFEHSRTCALRLAPDGKLLAAARWTPFTITLFPLDGKQPSVTWTAHGSNISDVFFSPNGKLLASTGHDGVARLWDVATQRELAVLKGHIGAVDPVAFFPDGNTLATGGAADHNILLWDVSAFGGQIRN